MASKIKDVMIRIERLEDAIKKAREYLECGAHADWSGFRALFSAKIKDGVVVLPHKDWVRSTFLPRQEQALHKAYNALERLQVMAPHGHSRRADASLKGAEQDSAVISRGVPPVI